MPPRTRFQALAFLGSFLAFCLELAAAKLLLPRFGGSAFVWTGAMMFFQAGLLLAYLYARWARRHPGAHAVALLLPFFFLPLSLPASSSSAGPLAGLMWALLLCVGAPFFVLSTTIVVAQSWYERAERPESAGGYFLYAASNAGAFCALFAYPLLLEPLLPLPAQGRLWLGLYALYAALCLSVAPRGAAQAEAPAGRAPTARERALWLLLSAAPCAALLAVTNLLGMDFAAVPLLWTAPLAVYLLTFVLNFKREPWYPETLNRALLPWAALCLVPAALVVWLGRDSTGAQIVARLLDLGKFGYLLFALFALGMIFHKSLVAARPASERAMAGYYGWIATGGLLGSALVGLAVPWLGRRAGATALDWAGVAVLVVAAVGLRDREKLARRPRTAVGLAALTLACAGAVGAAGRRADTLESVRNFYGVNTVREHDGVRWLFHGNTDHGAQFVDPARAGEPLLYYGRATPLGEAWAELGGAWSSAGIVGLGAGSIAAYGRPGLSLDFYELDPDVVALTRRWFTYLERSASPVRVVIGDGRLSLERADGAAYDALILDAFSSGAVPVHLLTTDAVESYLKRLKPGGVILFHVSNRYLDLRPVLAATARELGLHGASKRQEFVRRVEESRAESTWVAISRDEAAMRRLVEKRGWYAFDSTMPRATAWTDRHASLLAALAL